MAQHAVLASDEDLYLSETLQRELNDRHTNNLEPTDSTPDEWSLQSSCMQAGGSFGIPIQADDIVTASHSQLAQKIAVVTADPNSSSSYGNGNSSRKRKNEASSSAPAAKRNKAATAKHYWCRFDCKLKKALVSGEGLRLHMYEVHQLFPSQTEILKCVCGKRFGRICDLNKHQRHLHGCKAEFDATLPIRNMPYPQTREERADTWALFEDGPVANKLIAGREHIPGRGNPIDLTRIAGSQDMERQASEDSGYISSGADDAEEQYQASHASLWAELDQILADSEPQHAEAQQAEDLSSSTQAQTVDSQRQGWETEQVENKLSSREAQTDFGASPDEFDIHEFEDPSFESLTTGNCDFEEQLNSWHGQP